jgi:dUTP pyrophosphatase
LSNQIEPILEYIKEVKVFTPKHDYWNYMNFFWKIEDYQIIESDQDMNFGYIKTCISAKAPEKVSGNACYDLSYASDTEESIVIKPGERVMFSTGLILVFPAGYHGFILPRSGLSWKYGLDVMAGVIDNSFQYTTQVILINHSKQPYTIIPGDRIAQIELRKDTTLPVVEMTMEDLQKNNRGTGFGSSGR